MQYLCFQKMKNIISERDTNLLKFFHDSRHIHVFPIPIIQIFSDKDRPISKTAEWTMYWDK